MHNHPAGWLRHLIQNVSHNMNKAQIKNRITILLSFSILLLLTCITINTYEFFNSAPKTDDLNYGFMALIFICVLAIFGIFIDFILFKFIKNKWTLNLIELLLIICLIFYWYWK